MKHSPGSWVKVCLILILGFGTPIGFSGAVIALPQATEVLATTKQGGVIRAVQFGPTSAATRVVVIGQMHGNEPAGRRVVRDLTTSLENGEALPADTAIWLISTMNPDGSAAGTRVNALGVDLNRNFPQGWREQGRATARWSGPSAGSEIESLALMGFLDRIQPTAVLSFHQPFAVVDITHASSRAAGRQLATWLGLPARVVGCPGPCHGTLTGWVDDHLSAIALTVELPARVNSLRVDRSAAAVLRLTRWLAR
ncbi:murein peptide amidase A [Actinomycetes bacterium]|nr:murein peptide amidase A [Actinomycetes bacterium]